MITSNIAEVRARLQKGFNRIPSAIERVFQSEKYALRMWYIAGVTMDDSPLLTPDQKQYIPALLDTLKHATRTGMMEFSLQMISIERLVQDLDDPEDFLSTGVQEELLEWVKEKKELRAPRDYYVSGDQRTWDAIARRVAFAVRARPEDWVKSTNKSGLRYNIGLSIFPPETITELLRQILSLWAQYFHENLPRLLGKEIMVGFRP